MTEQTTDVPLPDVYRGALDADGVRALFADLGALPGPVEVRLKASAQARAQLGGDAGEITLPRAMALLLDGLVMGVQLVYEHDAQTWLDTVLRRGDGFEVVRMAAMAVD